MIINIVSFLLASSSRKNRNSVKSKRLISISLDHGGKYDFLAFAGQSTVNGNLFYTNVPTISLFKSYISFLLNHVNVYTGVALKDEPTILAWETGNELGAYMLSEGAPPAAWTLDITNFIKSLSPNSLVSDGSNGLTNSQGVETTNAFTVPPIDLVTDHFYPAANYLIQKDSGLVSSASEKKNYFVGELDWTGMHGGDNLSSFYGIVEGMGGSGSMIWSVFGHGTFPFSLSQSRIGLIEL